MTEDIAYMSATRLLALYRGGKLSPVEVTKAILDRIEKLNPKLNAFCLVDAAAAMAAARASEQRWYDGTPLGLLDGVPATIKDLVITKGWPTLRGSKTVDTNQAMDEDAPATARLRENGAVLLGKTTTPEFGWKGVTDSPLTGITRNPWNLERTPGGSSGGASSQVAAGLGPLAVGTDGGGSIRIPSAFTGIVGFKASFGRVPAFPASQMGTLAHVGPMARTVGDAALMLTALAQPDARDWFALPYDGTDWTAGLDQGIKGMRVAFSPTLGFARVDPEVAALVASAADAFATDLGAEVEATDPGFADPVDMFWTLWTVGAFGGLGQLPAEKRKLLEPELDECITAGGKVTLRQHIEANNARAALGLKMQLFHERYDLLLTPALAVPAFEVGRLLPGDWPDPKKNPTDWVSWTPFTYPFNLTQQPAITVPCGFTKAGLPVGLQIVGPLHQDARVLRAARAFELARPWAGKRPVLA